MGYGVISVEQIGNLGQISQMTQTNATLKRKSITLLSAVHA
jgi:hypothetical protein